MDQVAANRYLCFSMDKKRFATPLLSVKEVVGNQEATPIPHTPPYFRGVINLRGTVISIIDLRSRLKIAPCASGSETTIMILDVGQTPVGVVVDSVDCVSVYEKNDIEPAPSADFGLRADFLSGVAKSENSLTLILNLSALFGADDLKIIQAQQTVKAA